MTAHFDFETMFRGESGIKKHALTKRVAERRLLEKRMKKGYKRKKEGNTRIADISVLS